jgi:transcriptional regulator with XRE-family HTH domain
MQTPRRPGPAERHLLTVAGVTVKEARTAFGWTQRELAGRARTSQAAVWRTETGAGSVDLATLGRIVDAFGARVALKIEVPRLADHRRQLDGGHARCVSFVRHRLESAGWQVHQEVEIASGHVHGWIDLFALHAPSRAACLLEVKTDIVDAGELERQVGWYLRESWNAARRLGWRPTSISCAVVLLDTWTVARRLRDNAAIMNGAFPLRAEAILAWLTNPAGKPTPLGMGLGLVDPLSRRRAWLQRSVLDGRRRAARYADYADFMRRLEAPRRR